MTPTVCWQSTASLWTRPDFVIWTTTTWTLPANVATCLNPSLEYAFVKIGDEYHLMAAGLVNPP